MKRPHYIALGLVVVLTLIILNLPSETKGRLKLGIGSLFLPFFGITSSAQTLAGEAANAILPKSELLRQTELLRTENEKLRLQLAQSEETVRENAKLRGLLGWQARQPWKMKLAQVVLREPANWWRTIHIDLGTRDGARVDMPVISPDGLVGRISSVSLTRSQVVLLGDPNCKVAARTESSEIGVIGASGALDTGFVEMSYLPRNAKLKPGQNVYTSGQGGIFPKDILVGKIVEFQYGEYGLYTEAQVKVAANLGALEEVFVILNP